MLISELAHTLAYELHAFLAFKLSLCHAQETPPFQGPLEFVPAHDCAASPKMLPWHVLGFAGGSLPRNYA